MASLGVDASAWMPPAGGVAAVAVETGDGDDMDISLTAETLEIEGWIKKNCFYVHDV